MRGNSHVGKILSKKRKKKNKLKTKAKKHVKYQHMPFPTDSTINMDEVYGIGQGIIPDQITSCIS